MRKFAIFLICILLFSKSYSQFFNNDDIEFFKFGIGGGLNISNLKVDTIKTTNTALPFLGLSGIFNFNTRYSLRTGFTYSIKGGDRLNIYEKYRLNFYDTYIAPRINIIPNLFLECGLQYSILYNQYYKVIDGSFVTGERMEKIYYFKSRPEIFTALDIELNRRLSFNVKYSLPALNIESSNLMFGLTITLTNANPSSRNTTAFSFEELLQEPLKFTKLYLKNKNIESIPEEIEQCKNLEIINLDDNQISIIPFEFSKLINLRELYINNNSIYTLPDNFGNLENLRKLELSNNKINTLPMSFVNLFNLSHLDLSYNQIQKLDDNFGNLKSMMVLKLIKSGISELPNTISNLKKLEYLYIDDVKQLKFNPIEINKNLKINGNKIKK